MLSKKESKFTLELNFGGRSSFPNSLNGNLFTRLKIYKIKHGLDFKEFYFIFNIQRL